MSKKIIYLLSLLMALSLVFASCKKNGAGDITGGIQDENNPIHNEEGVAGGGLYDDFSKIPATEPITKDPVLKYSGDRGYRNPVGVVMGTKKDHVLVFSELRYAATTADNDIGVNGETAADIYLTVSSTSGTQDSFSPYGNIGKQNPQTESTPKDSHSAAIVFKVNDTTAVVVASGGVGISRVGTDYVNRTIKSQIDYCVITLTEATDTSAAKITSSEWKEVKVDNQTIAQKIEELSKPKSSSGTGWVDPTGTSFAQFGTHSARGFVDGNKLVLPVVVANQGRTGADTEYMGNLILISPDAASVSASSPDAIANWSLGSYTAFEKGNGSYTKQKESRVIGKSGSEYIYIVVPNGSADHKLTLGKAAESAQLNNAPTDMSVFSAWDGSLGYLTLDWKGANTYIPGEYSASGGNQKSLLMHVKDHESNPTIYLVNKDTITVAGNPNGWSVIDDGKGGAGKGSSIDVLGDGTVITVAEEKAPSGVRKFDIVFSRYSQAYLQSKIGG